MKQFIEKKNVTLSIEDEVYLDFLQLVKMSFIQLKLYGKFLILCDRKYIEIGKEMFDENIDILNIQSIFSSEIISDLVENKNIIDLKEDYDKFKNIFQGYEHIYFIDDFYNISQLRAFNRIMKKLEKVCTIGVIDSDNVYLTGIKYNYTGCFECLEKHIISKFKGKIEDFNKEYYFDKIGNKADVYLLFSIIMKDISNINIYGSSSLIGNVIHFYTPTFEYSFNVNRKHAGCPTCAKFNNILFEEQNLRSINMLKEILAYDKD